MHTDEAERNPLLGSGDSTSVEQHDVQSKSHHLGYLEGHQLYLALALPNMAMLLAAIDVTLTATLAATIASSFDSLSIISWLGTAYLVASSATQPLSGKLSDRLGRRNCFYLALILFAVGNLLCGVAQNTSTLIAGRAVAGAGGGAMGSITTIIINDLTSLRKRPVWQGVANCLWAAGMGLGGVIGGVVNDLVGWRWAFICLTPLTLAMAFGSCFTLPPGPCISNESPQDHIDVVGALTFTLALVCLILGFNITEQNSNWHTSLILLGTAIALLLCSVIWELFYARDPILPIRSLANRSVAAACVSSLFLAASIHTLVFYVPLQIQARGYNTAETGSQLLGEPVGAILGSLISGWVIQATGKYGLVKPFSFLFYFAAALGFFLSNLDTPIWVIELCLIAMEGGFAGCLTVILTGLLAATRQRSQAPTTGMLYAFRQIGASSGLALAGVLLRSHLEASQLGSLGVSEYGHQKGVPDIGKECNRHNVVGGNRPFVCLEYSDALHNVFLFTLITGAAAFAFGMLIRNISLDRDEETLVE